MHARFPAATLIAAAIVVAGPSAFAEATPEGGPWRQILAQDLAFVRDTLQARDIYAFTPDPAAWKAIYEPATKLAEEQAKTVDSFAGYRAVLKQYVASFQDPHLALRLDLQATGYQWPGFLARYQGGRFLVAGSQIAGVANGAAVSACDGRPVSDLVEDLAIHEGGERHTEAMKASMARLLFVDAKNPFVTRPKSCRIGGGDVELAWRPISADALAVVNAGLTPARETEIAVTPFGENGAWVRLPVFAPDKVQAVQFHALIDHAADLRTRSVIVLDVRGNGGGPYNWWVALLHGLYGDAYASYYARDRLLIDPVFVIDPSPPKRPASAKAPGGSPASPVDALNTPPDSDLDHAILAWDEQVGPDGRKVRALRMTDLKLRQAPTTPPPPNPVKARVYVLTDYGCGSSCVSFLDDMMRFPGVKQIGVEPHSDRRSGSPMPFPLPSGVGVLGVPSMVRLNRTRGDIVEVAPTYRFDGDMADTAALKRWVSEAVIPRDR